MELAPNPRIAKRLSRLSAGPGPTRAWKHTFAGQGPMRANTRGARWNPSGVSAIYLATDRETAIAEGRHLAGQQPQPIRKGRQIHELGLKGLANVLDLTDRRVLRELGISEAELKSRNFTRCQRLGGTAESLGYDAILVPSARSAGANLVVFERRTGPDWEASVAHSEDVPAIEAP